MTNEHNISVGVLTVKECFFLTPFQHNSPIYMSGPSTQFSPLNFPHWLSARLLLSTMCATFPAYLIIVTYRFFNNGYTLEISASFTILAFYIVTKTLKTTHYYFPEETAPFFKWNRLETEAVRFHIVVCCFSAFFVTEKVFFFLVNVAEISSFFSLYSFVQSPVTLSLFV